MNLELVAKQSRPPTNLGGHLFDGEKAVLQYVCELGVVIGFSYSMVKGYFICLQGHFIQCLWMRTQTKAKFPLSPAGSQE